MALDAKYGLKYSMPHSYVHIVDNSMNEVTAPYSEASDPSLLSTIVVTGSPIGMDNQIVDINNSAIANVSFGLGSVTASDIERYGQGITYAPSLINQGAPVKFMRVTPAGSTYAFVCLLVQWRTEETEAGSKVHVRYVTSDNSIDPPTTNGLPANIIHDAFKNQERFHDALVKYFHKDAVTIDGMTWKQDVFMTFIAAGRGSGYNKFNVFIDKTVQSKKPANVKYTFTTFDTMNNSIVEQFGASLINDNNMSYNAIEPVNIAVKKRVLGSSIMIPTVNTNAVRSIFTDYQHALSRTILVDQSSFNENVYKYTNINTFDVLFGRYLYEGDMDTLLPCYQVEMLNTEIPRLNETHIIRTLTQSDSKGQEILDYTYAVADKLEQTLLGINDTGDDVSIGDIYATGANNNPNLRLVAGINQASGAITHITIQDVYKIDNHNRDNSKSYKLRYIIDMTSLDHALTTSDTDAVVAAIKKKKSDMGVLSANECFVVRVTPTENDTDEFKVVLVTDLDKTSATPTMTIYSRTDLVKCIRVLDLPNTFMEVNGVSNIGGTGEGSAKAIPGAVYLDYAAGQFVVYKTTNVIPESNKAYYTIETNRNKFVSSALNIPTYVSINNDINGSTYDVFVYDEYVYEVNPDANIKIGSSGGSTKPGTGYEVGDIVTLNDVTERTTISFKVTQVDVPNGAVTKLEINDGENNLIACTQDLTNGGLFETTAKTGSGTGLMIGIQASDVKLASSANPKQIYRYTVTNGIGSVYKIVYQAYDIPSNYYSDIYGVNPEAELGGINVANGRTGWMDEYDNGTLSTIAFKWNYSALLVKAFKGEIDPRIMSPARVPAKFLFDAGFNTLIGSTMISYLNYPVREQIAISTIFTEDEKMDIIYDESLISDLEAIDVDVKQAMYDLMEYRCYLGIPEDKRPIGPGSGLSLHLDAGKLEDANSIKTLIKSFTKRFTNPNASWDIGGYTSSVDGVTYTYTKRIVDNLFAHIFRHTINKPFVGDYTSITPDEYTSFYPDIDMTDWDLREILYTSGGNAWTMNEQRVLQRKSQVTLYREGASSDLLQENNMRTLSRLVYMLQNKIDSYLLEYSDDGVLKTLSDECNNMFSGWVGSYVQALDISFERDIDPNNGGEIVVCYCNVTFRGLILRVPIIVNVQRRVTAQ